MEESLCLFDFDCLQFYFRPLGVHESFFRRKKRHYFRVTDLVHNQKG